MKPDNKKLELTEDQQEAFSQYKEWLESGEQFWTLKGYAGTGKTTLLDYFVQYAENEFGESSQPSWKRGLRTVITATTNKAVKVLTNRVDHSDFKTIHSLLNIKPKKQGAEEVFEQVTWNKDDITKYGLVVIDECSMISEKLFNILQDELKGSRTKVLFCGDPAQLPPINEELSLCFQFQGFELTEVIRHSDTISHKAKTVRNSTSLVPIDSLIKEPEISYISLREASKLFHNFNKHPDRARLLAWTNKTVQRWNAKLRTADWKARQGYEPETPFAAGDIIIAQEPCVEKNGRDERMLLLNSEEAKIEEVTEQYDSWYLKVRRESGGRVTLRRIKREYYKTWQDTLSGFRAANNWKDFWTEKKKYHNIRHAYALTTHKSQGSTFQNVIIDPKDINKNRRTKERNQLLYVAMTRAADNVYILQ